jgi:hypothetical protein
MNILRVHESLWISTKWTFGQLTEVKLSSAVSLLFVSCCLTSFSWALSFYVCLWLGNLADPSCPHQKMLQVLPGYQLRSRLMCVLTFLFYQLDRQKYNLLVRLRSRPGGRRGLERVTYLCVSSAAAPHSPLHAEPSEWAFIYLCAARDSSTEVWNIG